MLKWALAILHLSWALLPLVGAQASDRVYYFHNDHLGTPQAMTDAAGRTVWKAEFDPFGRATVNEDPDGDGIPVVNNLRFPGQYHDAETGLHYNYHRYYDPALGRYLQPDPKGIQKGKNHLYAYVLNNPTTFIDPRGTDIWVEGPASGEPYFHRSISVGKYGEGSRSWSFGLDENWKWMIPMSWRYGEVYEDVEGGGEIIKIIETCPEQDREAWRLLEAMEGEKDRYGIFYGNCRQFSDQMFEHFKDVFNK